ncbi:isoleucine--tRNA ligase [Candidatus Woesearchaeota archaeon]|nr:isoleucine--tRNA ligase [Candidatus Woesearchaeota archaeon]
MAEKFQPLEIEKEIFSYWKTNKIYEKAKKRNSGGKKFYFLDGPPYTSGKIHLGTAWNKALKDAVLRYKRMRGFDVWDRAGYDMHGMPTEHKAMDRLKLKDKEDIKKLGIREFVEACKSLSLENLRTMNEDFKRLGVWMDFDNAYQSITNEFMEGGWWLAKKAYEQGRLYEGLKSMQWCADCATALAKHELEYQNKRDDSIFLKFRVRRNGSEVAGGKLIGGAEGKLDYGGNGNVVGGANGNVVGGADEGRNGKTDGENNTYLLVWTTTPWTIAFNLGIMVHPDIDYLKVKVGDEYWYIAKALANVFIAGVLGKKYEVVEELKGQKLDGMEYIHPFEDELHEFYSGIKKASPRAFTVVLSEQYVDTSAGTGLVHMAPGCGPEDFEVGQKYKIPPVNALDEYGFYDGSMGSFKGLHALKDTKKFIDALEKRGALLAVSPVDHEYAHCWRCKNPVVFKSTKQWFFRVEDLKEKMRSENRGVHWVPDWAGSKWFDSWLENLRDNGITRQRYWGTPLPVWRCGACSDITVIGSAKELKKYSKTIPKDLHKPYIDEVRWKCRCGGEKTRIPDILDVWIDAGTASWTSLNFPQDEKLFKKLWPADFILEGKDQIRGWFNLLSVTSILAMGKNSYKSVYMHGFVQDAKGRKMSKSLGNVISPSEVVDTYGADTFRLYMIGGTSAGVDINYNDEDVAVKYRNLDVLWNLHNYLLDLVRTNGISPGEMKLDPKTFGDEERFILSRLNSAIRAATELFEAYRIDEISPNVESLFLEMSRTYIQLVREKASSGSHEEKSMVASVIYYSLFETLKLIAPFAPFIAEKIYLGLKERFSLKEESIHLFSWPKVMDEFINAPLEKDVALASEIIQSILAGREKMQYGIRWPLQEAILVIKDNGLISAAEKLLEMIRRQANIRNIHIQQTLPGITETVKPDFNQIGPDFGKLAPKVVAKLALESPQSILGHIQKEGKFIVDIDGDKKTVVKEHLIVERKVPEQYIEVPVKSGFVYLNKNVTKELEAEGYARELVRRIQNLRKTAGLEKRDRIELGISLPKEMIGLLSGFEDSIMEKVGAGSIDFEADAMKINGAFSAKEKIKGKEFGIWVKKC